MKNPGDDGPEDEEGTASATEELPRTSRWSRRQFLIGAGSVLAASALAIEVDHVLRSSNLSAERSASPDDGPILVLLTLYGGNDGVSTVVPLSDAHYESARPGLAIDKSSLLSLSDGYGLNSALPNLHREFQSGSLAVINGVGYQDSSLSHFQSMDVWQSGSTSDDQLTGWIGRWLDGAGSGPLDAISIGPIVPLALVGAKRQAAAVPPPPLTLPGSHSYQMAYAQLQGSRPNESVLVQQAANAGFELLGVQKQLAPILDANFKPDALTSVGGSPTNLEGEGQGALLLAQGGTSQSTDSVLADQLDLVSRMIRAAVPTKVYSVSLGGFDTHTDQVPVQTSLLQQLDTAVGAFLASVRGSSHGRPVVVFIYSEFGRRLAENGSGGTDHGEAGVSFVVGDSVKGGMYGAPSSLTKLDDGNLVPTTDFRAIYSALLNQVFDSSPEQVLMSKTNPLGIF